MSYTDVNRVVVIGRLTRDPELRALSSGSAVCKLRVASNSTHRTSEGEYREKPNFFNVSVFGSRGETVERFLNKGSRVAIDGRLEWGEWEAPDGVKRQGVEIVAASVQFLENNSQREQDSSEPGAGDSEEQQPLLVGGGSGIEDDVTF